MKRRHLRYLPIAGGALLVLLIVGGAVTLMLGFMNGQAEKPKKTVQQVTLIAPPPPPPPPEVKPPPPQPKQEVNVPKPDNTPKEQPDTADKLPPPIDDNLGLDAAGVAGADAFGLVGKRGGADLIGSGGGSRFRWYIGVVQNDISTVLSDHEDIRKDRYTVIVRLWLTKDGKVQRVQLVKPTGRHALDRKLRLALADVQRISEAPPDELPQPIELRINSRL